MSTTPTPKPRGLAAVDPERRRAIARLGGIAVQARGTGYRWTPAQAALAGKKGGKVSRRRPAR